LLPTQKSPAEPANGYISGYVANLQNGRYHSSVTAQQMSYGAANCVSLVQLANLVGDLVGKNSG
jgi:hypothetical protein